jgi:SAM-dependent methyltransferase
MDDSSSSRDWETFHEKRAEEGNYPQWPNEVMVKCLFGSYLENQVEITESTSVIDVGCGFGNNLRPFLDEGCNCYGAEIEPAIASLAQDILTKKGKSADIREGMNRNLPFQTGVMDLLLSVNVIHYEENIEAIRSALEEYCRVLDSEGVAFVMTVGPKHEIYQTSEVVGPHQHRVKDYDFRDSNTMFFFDNQKYLKSILSERFDHVETGRVREDIMTRNLDFLFAVAQNPTT